MIPEDLKYTREHEWIKLEGEMATVGITEHAQKEMGDLVYVELPAKGDQVETGKPMGTVESVKAVSEVFAPVSGEVVEVNSLLLDQPEKINEDPHGAGWMARIKLAGKVDSSALMSAAEYRSFLEGEQD
ncbi:MAG: glycine cleavage system protein GcvH [Acidobacteriota bacterium]